MESIEQLHLGLIEDRAKPGPPQSRISDQELVQPLVSMNCDMSQMSVSDIRLAVSVLLTLNRKWLQWRSHPINQILEGIFPGASDHERGPTLKEEVSLALWEDGYSPIERDDHQAAWAWGGDYLHAHPEQEDGEQKGTEAVYW